jgi:PhnB protein
MTHVFIYLLFNGTCADAMRFYERTLHGHVEVLQTVGESPMASQFPATSARRVIHARVTFSGNTIMASDWMAPEPYPGIRGMRVMLTVPDPETASRTFAALAEGGKIETPLGATPFARAYGTLTDRYGVPWQVMAQ